MVWQRRRRQSRCASQQTWQRRDYMTREVCWDPRLASGMFQEDILCLVVSCPQRRVLKRTVYLLRESNPDTSSTSPEDNPDLQLADGAWRPPARIEHSLLSPLGMWIGYINQSLSLVPQPHTKPPDTSTSRTQPVVLASTVNACSPPGRNNFLPEPRR